MTKDSDTFIVQLTGVEEIKKHIPKYEVLVTVNLWNNHPTSLGERSRQAIYSSKRHDMLRLIFS